MELYVDVNTLLCVKLHFYLSAKCIENTQLLFQNWERTKENSIP